MGVRGYFLARRQDLWRRARCHDDCHVTELGAIGCGAELCYLGATAYGTELRVQTCKLNFWGCKRKFLSPKGLKNKKFGQHASVFVVEAKMVMNNEYVWIMIFYRFSKVKGGKYKRNQCGR
jgi:hypothetical protein